ncbi:MAG: hypothetical protein EZS28_049093, partial [Streblomastix strix]
TPSPACQLQGGIQQAEAPLFVPYVDKVEGKVSNDGYGSDITFVGHHLVRCTYIRYEICEKYKVKEGEVLTEEQEADRQQHCQVGLLENGIQWNDEMNAIVQTRYKIVRKWKVMEAVLYFGDEKQTQKFDVRTDKMSTG